MAVTTSAAGSSVGTSAGWGVASGPFFFAWTGGAPLPAVSLDTTGDIWSGTFLTTATLWGGELRTTGDILTGGLAIGNLVSVIGLVSGQAYTIKAGGIPSIVGGAGADTTFTFDGAHGGTLSQKSVVAKGVSLTLSSSSGKTTALLDDFGSLVSGASYGIAGSGLDSGATFVFAGISAVTLNQPATATGEVSVTITSLVGIDVISNLADTTDLVVGLTYDVFGIGLPAGAQGVYSGSGEMTLIVKPTKTGIGVAINISKGLTYPDGGAFDASVHEVEDEQIVSLDLTQAEGGFAALTIEIRNPRIGLLAVGRNLWCWLSWRDGGGTVRPLFHGRLVGVPDNLQDEIVKLLFLARPNDFVSQKIVAANALRILPYWDPIWLIDKIEHPDTVLETYTSLWHIDPTSLIVTTSDIIAGEDGTLDIAESEHFYDAMAVTYGVPLRRVNVTLTATWTQTATGEVDLTDALAAAFKTAGSPYESPKISSYTADGLLGAWPLPGASLGGGWTIGLATMAELGALSKDLAVKYTDKTGTETFTLSGSTSVPLDGIGQSGFTLLPDWKNFSATFTLGSLNVNLTAHYDAARKRREVASFVVSAEVQSILTDPETADETSIALSSALIGEAVDEGGAMPIGDLRRNSYFPTDRGQQSLQYGILLAAAKLRAGARAVNVTFASTWDKLAGVVTCRKNVALHDGRLPGGQATGKVKSYHLAFGDTAIIAEATIGCSVGYGDTITAAAGDNVYADDYADDYTEEAGGQIEVVAGALVYQSLEGAYVIDDDGVDFLNMTADNVVIDILVDGGPDAQESAINDALAAPSNGAIETGALFVGDLSQRHHGDGAITGITASASALTGAYLITIIAGSRFSVTDPNARAIGRGTLGSAFKAAGLGFTLAQGLGTPFIVGDFVSITVATLAADSIGTVADPIGALSALPTRITVDLAPVTGGDFETDYTLKVLPLTVPKTIDLESLT